MPRQVTLASLQVLHAVAQGTAYGFDVIDETGLPGGTVYPALSRLERDGLLVSSWEDRDAAHAEGRPPRRYYRATAAGVRALNGALERLRGLRPVDPARRPRPARHHR
ncbi:MAG: PadR family transcriptional regulator [Vicinamibacterales bacterium]